MDGDNNNQNAKEDPEIINHGDDEEDDISNNYEVVGHQDSGDTMSKITSSGSYDNDESKTNHTIDNSDFEDDPKEYTLSLHALFRSRKSVV